jgi:hypothetical protein
MVRLPAEQQTDAELPEEQGSGQDARGAEQEGEVDAGPGRAGRGGG